MIKIENGKALILSGVLMGAGAARTFVDPNLEGLRIPKIENLGSFDPSARVLRDNPEAMRDAIYRHDLALGKESFRLGTGVAFLISGGLALISSIGSKKSKKSEE